MPEQVEQVLVIKSDWIHSLQKTRGFLTEIHPDFIRDLPVMAFFIDRPVAEKDPGYRQVIPYTLIRNNGKYLTVTRLNTQGESRLHNKASIGIGGHINPVDEAECSLMDAGLRRELSEELDADNPPGLDELKSLGLICDDTDEVSCVHLGLVLRWDVPEQIQIRETDKMRGEYLSPGDIGALYDRLENWSKLVYDGLVRKEAQPASSTAHTASNQI